MASAMTPKERIYAILRGEPIDRLAVTPIFMAWSAHFIGRTYRDYYLDADVLAASQQAVTQAFHLDQISAISDPWREASAYGMEFEYPPEGVGKPKESLIRDPDDVARVTSFEIEKAERPRQRVESVATMAAAVGPTHSVLGWVEGPIAEYADLRGVENTFMDLIDKPELYLQAAKVIVDNGIRFARAQIDAGADMIGVGDAVASLINPAMYEQFVLPFEKTLIDAIHEAGATVKLHICGNIANNIALMARTGADIIDVDWMVSLAAAREAVGPDVTLAGNFDPTAVLLQGTPQEVAEAARRCIASAGARFILQPGCEVPPGTPEANLRAFCPCEGCLIADDLRCGS
ncbi:MAG: uroporphyrinogen decarboxylase family protein [Planctomycetota bacterium]|nr:uroporphyrinogen decarboxylase family protein [Planctomycetota bacterium]